LNRYVVISKMVVFGDSAFGVKIKGHRVIVWAKIG